MGTQFATVSVVIPCYNAARFLRETLESAINQTHQPCEIIVVDDGSTDNSADIARSFGSPVRVILQPNQGESVARNRGLDEARGHWVAFLDADDVWDMTKLEAQVEALRNRPEVVCVHTNFRVFGDKELEHPTLELVKQGRYDVPTLITLPLINTSTAMVRRDLGVRFPVWTQRAEDMIYFAGLAMNGEIVYVDRVLVGYRHHALQQTRTSNKSFVDHHQSRMRWLESARDMLGEVVYQRARSALISEIAERGDLARWTRDWESYWLIRQYIDALPEGKRLPITMERIYPSFLYSAKDFVDGFQERYMRALGMRKPAVNRKPRENSYTSD